MLTQKKTITNSTNNVNQNETVQNNLSQLNNDKSAPPFTSFQIEAKCTFRQPVYFYFYQQFKLPEHHFKLRKNAQLNDLFLKKS